MEIREVSEQSYDDSLFLAADLSFGFCKGVFDWVMWDKPNVDFHAD